MGSTFLQSAVGRVRLEHGEQDANPNIREGTNRNAMTFPLSPFALIVGGSPSFLLGALPGELMKGIAQGLNTALTAMRLGIGPALKQDGGCPSKGLQTRSPLIARGIITDFRKQPRRQAFASAGREPKTSWSS